MKFLAAKSTATSAAPQERMTSVRRVTVAEWLSLVANPVVLIPAPGPGKLIVPISLIASGEGGAGYSGNPTICYNGDPLFGPFMSVSTAIGYGAPFLAVALGDGALRDAMENAPLVLTTTDGIELTDGDYDIDLRLEYQIVTL